MCVRGLPKVLEILEGVFDHSLVQRAEIRARMAEWVPTCEVPEVPINELPIEAVVVAHEHHATFRISLYPTREVFHHGFRIVKAESILARKPSDRESIRTPTLRNWFQPAIEGVLQPLPNEHSTKANHAVVPWDGAIGLHIHHYICHRAYSEFPAGACSFCGPIVGNMTAITWHKGVSDTSVLLTPRWPHHLQRRRLFELCDDLNRADECIVEC